MAFTIRQHNYDRPATAEQKKVFTEAWGLPLSSVPTTRVEAHLKIAELKKQPEKSALLKAWRERRADERKARREAHAAGR